MTRDRGSQDQVDVRSANFISRAPIPAGFCNRATRDNTGGHHAADRVMRKFAKALPQMLPR
jgi:hypothetical protein